MSISGAHKRFRPLFWRAKGVGINCLLGVIFAFAITSLPGCDTPSNQTDERTTLPAGSNTTRESNPSLVTKDTGPTSEMPNPNENVKTPPIKAGVGKDLDEAQKWASASLSDLELKIERHWGDAIRIDCIWRYDAFIAKFQNSSEPIARHWVTRAQRYRDDLLPFASADSAREEICKTMQVVWNKPLDRQAIAADGINIKFDEFGYPQLSDFYVASLEWLEASAYDSPVGTAPFRQKYERIRDNPRNSEQTRTAASGVLSFEQETSATRAALLARRHKKTGP